MKRKDKFADNSTISTEGMGKVMIHRKGGKPAFVTNVLYVPSMKTNLLSLGQLLEKGFSMNTKDNQIEVFDGKGRMVLKAPLYNNRTFKVNLNAVEVQCFSTSTAQKMNFKSLHQLGAKKMILGLPLIQPPKQVYGGPLLASNQGIHSSLMLQQGQSHN